MTDATRLLHTVNPAPVEGVVKFELRHDLRPLEERLYGEMAHSLSGWREVLVRLGGIGQDPARYGGAGYGNLSLRVGPWGEMARGRRRFLVTGTQTGGKSRLSLADCSVVESYDFERNRVVSFGATAPSSEAMTHGAIYDAAPSCRAVFHVHAPEIWRSGRRLGIPETRPEILYGTPDMAREVQRLFRETVVAERGILVMSGHEDGVIAFGTSAEAAGGALVRHLARALASGR